MAKQSMRIEYGKYLAGLGAKNKDIIVLEADLKESTQSMQFQNVYPERYIEVGIAEQNMVGIAAGLSLSGKIPIAHSFATFISMRACEQVRTTIAYTKMNVKFLVTHGGISTGTAGTTHHAIEDIAIMRAIPNMTVLVPGDVREMKQAVDAALAHKGPVYIRLGAGDAEDVYGEKDRFAIGRATLLRKGNDASIITTGTMAYEGVTASDILKSKYGLNVRVLQMASVKPLDVKAVLKAAIETGNIVTVEEHNILGGLGGAVCEVVAETAKAKVKRIGIQDCFSDIGSAACLMKEEGLTVENVVKSVRDLVRS
ncbi:MAG: transketolase family protein [Nitrospirae bacterium]|nr:transketolase family protein [Nitrospirota bacterium]